MITGEELIRRRTRLGITQTALSDRSNVTRSDLCRQERGRGTLGPITEAKVRRALDELEKQQHLSELNQRQAEAHRRIGASLAAKENHTHAS